MSHISSDLVVGTASVNETLALGERLGSVLTGGLTIGLVGSLGSGKTYFVKGLAAGNGLDDASQVTSPTFTLIHEYPGRLTLFHLDTYRLANPSDLLSLGFEELITAGSVVVVEWADRVRSLMPDDSLWIELAPTGETSRRLTFRATGSLARKCLEVLRTTCR